MNDLAIAHHPPIRGPSLLASPLDRHAARAMARARLRSELRSIALELLGPCEPGDVSREMAAWIDKATETAVSGALDTSMSALMQSLETAVAGAPIHLVDRLAQAAVRRDAGIE